MHIIIVIIITIIINTGIIITIIIIIATSIILIISLFSVLSFFVILFCYITCSSRGVTVNLLFKTKPRSRKGFFLILKYIS